jgi:hypothetical protein
MKNRLVRLLVLACSMVLALPPSWCCLLADKVNSVGADAAKICPCCAHRAKSTKKIPLPPPTRRCPCSDRNAIRLEISGPKTILQTDLCSPGEGTVIDLTRTRLALGQIGFHQIFPATSPIHVLNCQWLC